MSRAAGFAEKLERMAGRFRAPRHPVSTPARPSFLRRETLALVLGLQGLALLVVFPFGPQETRLWRPGVPGVALMAAAFPLAAVIGGLLARRARLPRLSPRVLAWAGALATLPCLLAPGYVSLVSARLFAGLLGGFAVVAAHRSRGFPLAPGSAQLASRVVAFGMPACLAAATALGWRAAFALILIGFVATALLAREGDAEERREAPPLGDEPAPFALFATVALAFVTGGYLTVLSGYLVFNAGHAERHIPMGLLAGAAGGLLLSPRYNRIADAVPPRALYAGTLAAAALSLAPLLALQRPLPVSLALAAIAGFLIVGSFRHLALARLAAPATGGPGAIRAHLAHTQLAQHLGLGLGALAAGRVVRVAPEGGRLTGMSALLACALVATALALAAGLRKSRTARRPARD